MTTTHTVSETLANVLKTAKAKMIINVDSNTVKGSFGRGKFVSITYNTKSDSFDIHSYRVVGVELVGELKTQDVMIEQLLDAVKSS